MRYLDVLGSILLIFLLTAVSILYHKFYLYTVHSYLVGQDLSSFSFMKIMLIGIRISFMWQVLCWASQIRQEPLTFLGRPGWGRVQTGKPGPHCSTLERG